MKRDYIATLERVYSDPQLRRLVMDAATNFGIAFLVTVLQQRLYLKGVK